MSAAKAVGGEKILAEGILAEVVRNALLVVPLVSPRGDVPRRSGLYLIYCEMDGLAYTGSAVNLAGRRQEHLRDLRQERIHHSPLFQEAWDSFSEEDFQFAVLEYVKNKKLLTQREQPNLDRWWPLLYNACPTANSTLGYHFTPEQCQEQSERNKELWCDPEYRERVGKAMKELCCDPEYREKMSQAMMGNQNRVGWWARISKEQKAEHGRRMSESSRKWWAQASQEQKEERGRRLSEGQARARAARAEAAAQEEMEEQK